MSSITLVPESQLAPQVNRLLARISAELHELIPSAEIHHVGATAIPGALTKGDLDLAVRVAPSEFQPAIAKLKTVFEVKQPQNWREHFASFGDDTGYELPLGIQLIVRSAENDFLVFLRDYLIQHPEALVAYNQLKLTHAGEGSEGYWQAKHRFFSEILGQRSVQAQPSP